MKVAFLFPGQGSQSIGMLRTFIDNSIIRDHMVHASNIIDVDLISLIDKGPKSDLDKTINTQPLLLASSIAIWKLFCSKSSFRPNLMAGHSLGEISALTAAGVFDFSQAVSLVRYRACVMQDSAPLGSGSMAAILGLDIITVENICKKVTSEYEEKFNSSDQNHEEGIRFQDRAIVDIANINTDQQIVISGTELLVEKAMSLCKAAGSKRVLKLQVSGPFHSSLLAEASVKFKERLQSENVQPPSIPVVNNVDVEMPSNTMAVIDSLGRQIMSTVRWSESVRKMMSMGVLVFVECGPGKVLSGLVRKICPKGTIFSLSEKKGFDEAVDFFEENSKRGMFSND